MAMGRGLTLQIEDGSYSLNSWNSIQPGRVKKSTETRQSHGKKLGGHFQLAVNFQKPKLPAKQLVTPASLMSSTLQPGQKSLSKDLPNFDDATEDTFSEDEDSSQDEENDDDDDSDNGGYSGDQIKGAYNYRDSIPVLSDGGEGSSVSSSDEEEYSSHAEEVKDAIDSMEEIQREELGFTLLKDSNRPEDDSTRDKRKVVSLLGSMSPSSDKENLTDNTIVRVKGSDRNQSLRSTSSEQMATGLGSDLHNVCNGQSKQPLTDSANTTIKAGNKPIILNENAGRGSSQRSSSDRNKRNLDYTVTGIQQENLLISVPPKGDQWMPEKPMVGHHTPPEQEIMFCGSKISQQSNKLSASAAPFVPQRRNDRIRERGPKSHSWIGLDNEATSWSSGFNIQEEHSDDAGGTGQGSLQGNHIGITDDSLVNPEIGRHKPLNSLTTTTSNPTEYPQQGQGSSTAITGGALARSKFEDARRGSPIQTDLKTSREGSPGFPEMTVNKPAIRNNRNPLSEMPTTSFTGVHGTGDRAGLAGRKVTTNACNNDKRISDSPGVPSGSGVTITDPSSSQAITQHSRNEEASSSNRMKESKGQLGRTQAPVISEREAGQDVRRGGPSQDGGGGIVSTRIQPSGKLSDAERTNEYEWRKFKVVRKVKKVLKSAGTQTGKAHLPEDVTDQLLEIIIDMSDSFLVFEDKPQEVAIVLEEVILQAVEETAEDDDYQREFITLLQKLSSIIKNFEKELKSALKLVEAKHIQAFTGAHTEKMGLSYCRFLGRLSFGFSVLPCPTKVMLEELISLLTNKWIIFNEKGTNPNAEVTEMSFAKCLKVVMKEIGPCYPEKKWKNLLEAVRGQIFGKRSQTVKEIFLEILLHSETLPRSSTAAEPEVNRTNEPADFEDSSASKPTKEKDDSSKSNDGSKTEKERPSTSESGISEESPVIDVGKKEPKSPSPTLSPYNDSMKATYLSTKVRCYSRGRDHADDDVKSQTMGSGIVERNKTAASDNREAFDWWDLETVNKVSSGHLRKEKDKVREARDDCISKQDNPECIKQGQHETKQGHHHVPRHGHHVSKMDHQAPKEGHHVPEQVTREQQARESGSSANVKDEATEIWDEELITNPSPLMYPSALKRRMNENSLRGQRERFEINIGQATRTFEVCSGNNNNNVTMRRDYGAIIQADDDVIILEDSSDSDSETDEDVPLIWGDLNSTGHVQQQDHASNTPSGFQQNMQRGVGSAVSQTLVGQQNGEAGEPLVVCQTPWSNQTLMVFQEEEDTECALSAVEIMAQRSLAERRRFGRGHLWHSANSTPWNEVNNQS